MTGQPERVGIKEAALITGLKPRTLEAMARQGRVPSAAKLGKLWSFNVERLRQWLSEQETRTATYIREVPSITVTSRSTADNFESRYKQLIGAKQNAA